MLQRLQIDGFQKIAHADLELHDHPIHVFCGDNEAGKTTLIEAVSFALRGISPRVGLKKQFVEMVTRGRKTGAIKLVLDGFDVTRNVKTGELKTTAALDYPDLLVDILTALQEFGRADPIELKRMLQKVFKVEATTDVVKARLRQLGVIDAMLERVLPLLKVGFESSSKTAGDNQKEQTGKWRQLTGEVYGVVKAADWTPAELAVLKEAGKEDLIAANQRVNQAQAALTDATKALGAIEERARVAEKGEAVDNSPFALQELKDNCAAAQRMHQQFLEDVVKAKKMRDDEIALIDQDIARVSREIQTAKMAAATLECSKCGAPQKLNTDQKGKVSLVSADAPRREGPSLDSLTAELNESQGVKEDVRRDREAKITGLEKSCIDTQKTVADCLAKIAALEASKHVKPVTAEEVTQADRAVKSASETHQLAVSARDKLVNDSQSYKTAVKKQSDAKAIHEEAVQWGIIADALSNKPDSIPTELLMATIGPLNREITRLCLIWQVYPFALMADMALMRGDGTPYYMLSKSAKWRVEAVMRLALAKLSGLKIACIDEFDILRPDHRGAFIELLTDYAETARADGITVLVMGTLSRLPDSLPGVKCWWIEDGVISNVKS